MGRGRGKGKKQSTTIASRDDNGSGEDDKLPVRRRGRPQKPTKDEIDDLEEEEVDKIDEDSDETKSNKNQLVVAENGKKRKKPSQIKEIDGSLTEEDNATVVIKSVGFRQIGSRRKNKPRRAAEVGVECK